MNFDTPESIWEHVPECAIHPTTTEQDCEFCEAEVNARNDVVQKMSSVMGQIIGSLAQQGVQPPPPHVMLEAKIDVLCDVLFQNPKDRLKYEGEVGRRLMRMVKDVQADVKQPALLGVNGQRLRAVKDNPQA